MQLLLKCCEDYFIHSMARVCYSIHATSKKRRPKSKKKDRKCLINSFESKGSVLADIFTGMASNTSLRKSTGNSSPVLRFIILLNNPCCSSHCS